MVPIYWKPEPFLDFISLKIENGSNLLKPVVFIKTMIIYLLKFKIELNTIDKQLVALSWLNIYLQWVNWVIK